MMDNLPDQMGIDINKEIAALISMGDKEFIGGLENG